MGGASAPQIMGKRKIPPRRNSSYRGWRHGGFKSRCKQKRNLVSDTKVKSVHTFKNLKQEAKQRQGMRTDLIEPNVTLSSNELEVGQARDIVADRISVSPTTFQRAFAIIEKGDEKLKQKLRDNKISITYAYKMLQRQEEHREPPELPLGEFDVIYADPPWEYYLPLRGSPDSHYQVMKTDDICALEVPVATEGSILFLWATNPKLEDALKVIRAWGFEYKTNMVWIKDKQGTGYYFRGQHELLLVATKGKMPTPMEESRYRSVLEAKVTQHSHKPDVVYEIIERMYPNRRYLELFARQKREKWESWGNEA